MRRAGISCLLVTAVLVLLGGYAATAEAGTYTVTADGTNCGVLTPVTNAPGMYLSSPSTCSTITVSAADDSFPEGAYGQLVAYAPSGISIVSATASETYADEDCCGSTWWAGSFWAGGSHEWGVAYGLTEADSFPAGSPYWGFEIYCNSNGCGGSGDAWIQSVTLTAAESQGPTLTVGGGTNLWNETQHYVWNPPGDPWPLSVSGTDPSGVCQLGATVEGIRFDSALAAQNTHAWQQCPNPSVWTSADGAKVDTRTYVPAAGSMPLTLWGTNAAGVEGSLSTTIPVDNDPVQVALSSANDPDPDAWVNHAVTVNAAASAGPSGVGGETCSIDNHASQPYSSSGLAVNGDGVHTVSCTASNKAVDPQGQPNTGSSTMSVHIDEAPPTLSFEPQQPGNPTSLVVNTTDSESGVAGGSVEIAPAGSGNWTALPTTFDGAHLLAHLDDTGLSGPYAIRATSCDNVGNCATTTETLTMPLRLAAVSDVSFATIGTPAKVVRERVLVGFRYKREQRHGRIVKVRSGGHYRTISIVIPPNTRCGHKLVKTGPHLWQETTVCRPLNLHVVTTKLVPYGKAFTIHGLLVTTQGVPVSGAPVAILTAPANGLGQFATAATATTTATGAWTATLPPGPSRLIRTVYGGSATVLPAAGQATVNVPASITLTVSPSRVPWSGLVTLRGHLDGGYVPPDGVALRLLIELPHRSEPYEPVPFRTNAHGDFVIRWSWGAGSGTVTYPFAIATTATESDYPFAASRSRWVPVTFGAG